MPTFPHAAATGRLGRVEEPSETGPSARLVGTVVNSDETFIGAAGGRGANPGAQGRFILGKNAGVFDPVGVVGFIPGPFGRRIPLLGSTINARAEFFDGPRAENPFIARGA